MPPKAQKEIIQAINSPEHFLELISPENKKLAVIDIHLTWCGPCVVMNQNYRTIWFNYEEADKRLEFYTIDSTVLPKEYADKFHASCKPRFVIYLEGELKANIDGADYTKIESTVSTYIPSLDE
ncbi:hypothetical protein FGO68_gene1080 [Halteria grandinella]|uniref:Thioredoxin domain-containing protein n=1 Tax=Halteria grandinella TaxID=5974 RepID=A0A8J8T889_HALGN|nr:hypothetical protein FGO68_gene1080 [Halteria grandinella]